MEPRFSSLAGYEASWLVLGSLARREPLPFSDVDTAVVWRDHAREGDRDVHRIVTAAAESVIQRFEMCGLRRCPDGANATNPLFNRSLDDWIEAARRWIREPDQQGSLLLSAMVTDCRPVTDLALGRSLVDEVDHIATTKRFLKRMLDAALGRRPPTGFVRDFVVDDDGAHRGQLDLKKGGLGPVVAIGRWIAVTTRAPATTTHERLEQGAATGLLTRDETDTLRTAHREMYELLFAREIEAAKNSTEASTYLDPKHLDSLTRRHLRESFRAIARVQTRLEGEWVSRILS
jgi:CBS domain-containing protein